MTSRSRLILLALIGIGATAGAYLAALAALPRVSEWTVKQLLADHSGGGVLWLGYDYGSIVFLCCLFAGLVQAAILALTRIARPYIAVATIAGSLAAWAIQAYAVAYKGVSGYPFSGHGALFGMDRSVTANDFIIYVTAGFVLVGICQAFTIRRSAVLAVFWPVAWLLGGLISTYAISQWQPTFTTQQENLVFICSGLLLGLFASIWVFVPIGIRVPLPGATPTWAAAAVGAAGLVGTVVGGGIWLADSLYGPIDDPAYFCASSDPSPAAGIAASLILQDCAAGKTYILARGATVAIDLPGGHGIDTSTTWKDVGVSNESVLATVAPLGKVGNEYNFEEVAVYRASQKGESTISATQVGCSANFGGTCDRDHRWVVKIEVT